MIKCDKGIIEMKGTPAVLTAELGVITREVYRSMISAGLPEDFAKKKNRGSTEKCSADR